MRAIEHDEYSYSVFFVLTCLYYDIKSIEVAFLQSSSKSTQVGTARYVKL